MSIPWKSQTGRSRGVGGGDVAMEIWIFAFLIALVGFWKAIGTLIKGYAIGLAIGIGLILLLILLGMCSMAVR